MNSSPILNVNDVTVQFGGVTALSGVSIQAKEGEITGLIGPNGAGKSTLLGVLSGLVTPLKGRVSLDGEDVTQLAPHLRAKRGMSRTFQQLELWGSMSVRENILTAAEFAQKWNEDIDPTYVADKLIKQFDLTAVADRPASGLSSGTGRLTEVARALASSPRIILLDEPSAGLDDFETRELNEALESVVASGTSIIIVEHHMEMIMRLCHHIWVLDFGLLIANGNPDQIRDSKEVQAAYLGTKHATRN